MKRTAWCQLSSSRKRAPTARHAWYHLTLVLKEGVSEMQNAHGIIWSNQHRQGPGQQVTPTLRAMQLRADGTGPHVVLAAGSHLAAIISAQGHQLELLNLPVSHLLLS